MPALLNNPLLSEAAAVTPAVGPSSSLLASTPVYPLIHEIRQDVIVYIDTPLSWEQLHASDTTYSVVQPLTEKYLLKRSHAIVFCLLINRIQFIRNSQSSLSISLLSLSRAALCELLAIRLLRAWSERTLELAHVLLTPWDLYQGASEKVRNKLEADGEEGVERVGNALEMAIISKSKNLIKSASFNKVIQGIWTGRVVYQAASVHAIIADNYKTKPIHLYNPHKAPLLDHYRLKVPRIRALLELSNFLILFVLFLLTLELGELDHVNVWEWGFIVYAAGFSLDKVAATQEHGMQVYSANLWNGFDLAFVIIYLAYLSLRGWGLAHVLGGGGPDREWAAVLGVDLLAIAACVMFPRLAFVSLSDNIMILALRSMVMEFGLLMLIAVFCFLGFLYALWTLSEKTISIGTVSWWMLDIWFGLDASGFDQATTFHPFFGPIVMVTYACLSNTLILTVLVAILSKTFADISQDASAEAMFRKAVSTVEGVKSDAVFSYQAPFNLIAVLIMLPLKLVLSPRFFHKVNVVMIRASAFPILIFISLYERQVIQKSAIARKLGDWFERAFDTLPRSIQSFPLIEGLVGSSSEISQVFDIEDALAKQENRDDGDDSDAFAESDHDVEQGGGGGGGGKGRDVGEEEEEEDKPPFGPFDHPVFSPETTSPAQMSPASEQPPALSTLPAAETPRKVAFPDLTHPDRTPSSPSTAGVGIPSPRKRIDSLDGFNRVRPSPLAQIYGAKLLSASHQPPNALSSAAGAMRGLHRRAASSSAHEGAHHRRAFSQSTATTSSGVNPRLLQRPQAPPSTIPEGRVAFSREPSPAPRSLPQGSSNLTQALATPEAAAVTTGTAGSGTIGKASDVLETGDVGLIESRVATRVHEVERRLDGMTDLLERILDRLPAAGADSRRASDARGADSGDDLLMSGWQNLR